MESKAERVFGVRSLCDPRIGLGVMLAACLVLAAPASLHSAAATSSTSEFNGRPEYEARAAFLILLSKYTQWPESVLPAGGEFVIGVLGEDPFGASLDVHAGSFIQGRRLVVRRFRSAARIAPCHLLYFPGAEEWHLSALRQKLAEWNVLTVGESPQFIGSGGGIRLFTEGGSLRFEVGLSALDRGRVQVEAKVLRLARQVH